MRSPDRWTALRWGKWAAARCAATLALAALACVAQLAAADSNLAQASAAAPSTAAERLAESPGLSGYRPLTTWLRPPLELPLAPALDYHSLAEAGTRQAAQWRHGPWYCEYLGCTHGPYPLLSIWGEVPMFEAADALEMGSHTPAHRALVDRFARANERFWDPALGGYAPYPDDREAHAQAFFDDNGWLGIAFVNAYKATHQRRWLRDAQRAFSFISSRGWDWNGGGIWWNTSHPYHSGPAIAADSLLGALLFGQDHERWQIEDVKMYVDWANTNDNHDGRQLYLEQADQPESANDYVQAPLVYAQYLLCEDGLGESYGLQAGRVAATLAEEDINDFGFEYNYGPQYDTIFMQWMMAYGEATGQGYWLTLAKVNAVAAAAHAGGPRGLWLSSWWGGEIEDPETQPDMFRTAAATTSLFAWVALYSAATAPVS